MTDEAFLCAIAESPRDDTHRLVYADWLEERGDPRAEWLRLQETLRSPVPDKGRYTDLCAREQELWRTLDPVWLHAVRRYTTPPPCRDIAKLVPALAPFARTTTRLHPRRAPAPLPAWVSKIGGPFWWPEEEPYPECPQCAVPLAPVIQLRAVDVPAVAFPPGLDLFQLFWCPDERAHDYEPAPHVDWRKAGSYFSPWRPRGDLLGYGDGRFLPVECSLFPEQVTEYPVGDEVDWLLSPHDAATVHRLLDELDLGQAADLEERFRGDEGFRSASSLAFFELGRCPGTKAGGIGFHERGQRFDHFLTLATWEVDAASFRRWLPIEDQRRLAEPGSPLSRESIPWEPFRRIQEAHRMHLGRTQRAHLWVCREQAAWEVRLNVGD
jgi:uncharacterized protein (TIGR02996 family)